jgi:hypothetical protein
VAYIESCKYRLVSRDGHAFNGFHPLPWADIRELLRAKQAVIDSKICCLGKDGRSDFNRLCFRKGTPHFYPFDLVWLDW